MFRHHRNSRCQDDGGEDEVRQQCRPSLARPSRPGNEADREGGEGDREPLHLASHYLERPLPAHQTGREDTGAADNRHSPSLVPLRLDR